MIPTTALFFRVTFPLTLPFPCFSGFVCDDEEATTAKIKRTQATALRVEESMGVHLSKLIGV
jgi:hypothetical protein